MRDFIVYLILIGIFLLVLFAIFLPTSEVNKSSQRVVNSKTDKYYFDTICINGLSVIEISYSKNRNGYIYERTKDDKLIPCSMEVVEKDKEVN